ncbi:glutamate--tRNA ligase family protein [Candidatus Carsonella ruddii]|uniref:glutamate--tRNA ligase family protein n=1 Tax=Carsonella ruddii TaxID=114186 RepID=UPI003D814080
MYNLRIAISPSGYPHIGNNFVIITNYLLKNKIFGNIFLRFDDTNEKKNKLKNKFYIINNLKKNGIFIKKIINQKYHFFYYFKKKIDFKKCSCKKNFFNNKIIKKNIIYSVFIIFKNLLFKFKDNNYGLINYKILIDKIILFKNNMVPSYNFSSIIDDYIYDILIIIRGKEWLNQIPFQLLMCKKIIYFYFNHMPNINHYNGKKLSKRNFINKNFLNIFFFLKKIKNVFKKNKNYKLLLLEKSKKKKNKINNYIMINLLNLLKNLDIRNIFNLIKIKTFFLEKINNINIEFSNFNFLNKIILDTKNVDFFNKIKEFLIKFKKYEFI